MKSTKVQHPRRHNIVDHNVLVDLVVDRQFDVQLTEEKERMRKN